MPTLRSMALEAIAGELLSDLGRRKSSGLSPLAQTPFTMPTQPLYPDANIHYQPVYQDQPGQGWDIDPRLKMPVGSTGYGYRGPDPALNYDIQEPGIEAPHPLLDPVDYTAGAMVPMGLRGLATIGQSLHDPLPMAVLRSGRQGVLRNQRGSLGPFRSQGQPLSEGVVAFHGSPADFDTFALGKRAAGRGGTSFGLGINLSEDVGHAKVYSGKDGFLYTVNIPKDAKRSFIAWETPVPKNLRAKLPPFKAGASLQFGGGATIEKIGNRWMLTTDGASFPLSSKEFQRMFGDENTGEQVYRKLVAIFGNEEAASQWLLDNGVKGILNNTERGVRNYTVFDPSILSITEKTSLGSQ